MPIEAQRSQTPRLELGLLRKNGIHRVASVAVPASPLRIHLLAKVLEDVLRPALRSLAELDHRAELLLIHCATLLVVLEVSAQIHSAEIFAEALPFTAAVLADQAVSLEQGENDLRL